MLLEMLFVVMVVVLLYAALTRPSGEFEKVPWKSLAERAATGRQCCESDHDLGMSPPDESDGLVPLDQTPANHSVLVRSVLDGDTIVVSTVFQKYIVRLDSIDAPEHDQHWGDCARFALQKMIAGKKVLLENHGVDHRGRVLSTIYLGHESGNEVMNVNERMVSLGHAWVMHAYYGHLSDARQAELCRLEDQAKSRKLGLWRTHTPIPPWKWRRET